MFVSNGQFYVLLICVGIGFVSGSLFTLFLPIKNVLNNYVFSALIDVLIFILLCFGYSFCANFYSFPNFRFYMVLGVMLGIILYVESFNFILAKIGKIIYNKLAGIFAKRKTKAKLIKGIKTNERI